MRKLLYLLKSPVPHAEDLLPQHPNAEQDVSVVLIQEGVAQQHIAADRVYALSEDAAARGRASVFPTVSYEDLVRMIFEADTVIAL
ncbi:MAG: hypothetical protein ACREJU_05295 [Nitrospiraceae bacterium]